MGMFDDVKVDYPLPGGIVRDGWQTKSLDCLMDKIEIRADGSLWRTSGWLATPEGQDPITERLTWTGELRFYDWDPETKEMFEFVAVFHDGLVQRISRTAETVR